MNVKKLMACSLPLLLAGVMIFAAGCGSEASSPVASPSTPSPAVKLAFITQPAGATADSDFETQPVVAFVDAEGNIVTGYKGLIELKVTAVNGSAEAQLFGGTTIISENGAAVFKSLSFKKAGTFTLTATSRTLEPATSEPFSITPGPPAQLAFITAPSGGIAGSPLTPQPVVTVQDHYGNMVTDYEGSVTIAATISITVKSTDPNMYGELETHTSPVAIHGTLTVPVVETMARFTDISADKAIPGYRLTATSGSLEPASSQFFVVSTATPAQLEFTVQPQGTTAGIPFDTQPKVAVVDAYGNVVKSARELITLSITPGSGAPGAILSGTTSLVAADVLGGVAEFKDLSIDLAGLEYTLTATAPGLLPDTSQALDISAP